MSDTKEESREEGKALVDQIRGVVSKETMEEMSEKQKKIKRKIHQKHTEMDGFTKKNNKDFAPLANDFKVSVGLIKEMKDDLRYIQTKITSLKERAKRMDSK